MASSSRRQMQPESAGNPALRQAPQQPQQQRQQGPWQQHWQRPRQLPEQAPDSQRLPSQQSHRPPQPPPPVQKNALRDSRGPTRSSQASRPTPIPIPVPSRTADGQDVYFPLSPAPHQRKSDAATRITLGSDSDILPPEDRNYLATRNSQAQKKANPPHRIIHANLSGPPSVYWSDDGASNAGAETATIATMTTTAANPSAFTFYREGEDDEEEDEDDVAMDEEKRQRQQRGLAGTGTGHGRARGQAHGSESGLLQGRDAPGGSGNGNTGADAGSGDALEENGSGNDNRNTADFEFVNGRYVPPGLRNGRPPGRKPLYSDQSEQRSGSYAYDVAEEKDRSSVCGGRTFWMIGAVILFVVVGIAVGVGVGVGIGAARKSSTGGNVISGAASSVAASAASASATAAAATTTARQSQTTAATQAATTSAAAAAASSPTDCPAANGTLYDVPGSNKSFLRLCGIDFSGTGEAVDLSHLPTASMAECMNNCAGTTGCTGCGWGPPSSSSTSGSGGDSANGGDFQCYMKSTLGKSQKAASDWSFAILQD